MPIYTYQCSCGLRFENFNSGLDSVKCPSCGGDTKRKLVGFSYASNYRSNGVSQQDTGVASHDYDYDGIIADDSRQKWKTIKEREAHKERVLSDNPGARMWELEKTPEGEYKVMDKEKMEMVIGARTTGALGMLERKRLGEAKK